MRRLRGLVESVRHLRLAPAGHRLVRSFARRPGAPTGRPPASRLTLAPLPTLSRRPQAAPFDRPEGAGWRIAGALVKPVGGGTGLGVEPEGSPFALDRALAAAPVRALAEAGDVAGARAWLAAVAHLPAGPAVRARRALALVEARCAGLVEADAALRDDLSVLARHPPWDERGLPLAFVGAALYRGGAGFGDAAARGWRERGASILSTCAAEQVLSDGTHVERGPVAHALLLEMLLVALSTAEGLREAPPRGVHGAAARLAAALPAYRLADGEPLRTRADTPGDALPPASLLAWAPASLGPPPFVEPARTRILPAAGVAILSSSDGRSAATLWAASSPSASAVHGGAADALAIEVVLDGLRVVATACTTQPDGAGARPCARSPGVGACPSVDGIGSPGAGGPEGDRPRGWARRLEASQDAGGSCAEAYAGGLRAPARGVVLRRVVRLCDGPCVIVIDEAVGPSAHDLSWVWPLTPGLVAHVEGDGARLVGFGREFAFAAPDVSVSQGTGLFARGPGLGEPHEVLITRVRRTLPTRVLHALAPGPGPLRVRAAPIPGGELRVEVEGAFGRAVGFVPLGRRP